MAAKRARRSRAKEKKEPPAGGPDRDIRDPYRLLVKSCQKDGALLQVGVSGVG